MGKSMSKPEPKESQYEDKKKEDDEQSNSTCSTTIEEDEIMAAIGGLSDSNEEGSFGSIELMDVHNNNEPDMIARDDSNTTNYLQFNLQGEPSSADEEVASMMGPPTPGTGIIGRMTRSDYQNLNSGFSQSVATYLGYCEECCRPVRRCFYDLVVSIRLLDVIFLVVFVVVFIKLGRFDEKFDRIDEKFDRIDEKFDRIDEKLETLDEEILMILNTTHGETVGAHHG
eukprot:CAMPEP_0202474352 /NCGR_PEP_ID=MMETSP1360-20130828/92339_1 /ASSEMBLY_ACC=CAM_ASM_000848 /TAXON_ID=515479 /ORGANISM="Licmophora paradoxa, Strain CCMP2313" /LENGTH=226 /DNA_ID=CAMNT_0049101475 /DNA_START=771 /DNA_END=1451 /DNA_ORIENTATION=-